MVLLPTAGGPVRTRTRMGFIVARFSYTRHVAGVRHANPLLHSDTVWSWAMASRSPVMA